MSEQQQESLKVYELAKELGLDSFSLLDKLKQINIEVKSHMSSLAFEQVNAVREAIKNEKKGSSGATTVKKRTAATSTAGSAAAAAPAAKKTTKKASAAAPATTEAATAPKAKAKAESAASAESKKKVIKRRTGQESESESTTSATPAAQERTSFDNASLEEESAKFDAEALGAETIETPVEAAPEELTEEVAPARPSAPQVERPDPRKITEEYGQKANAPGTKVIFRTPNKNQRAVEKDELLDEFSSRRLKIVQAAPPAGSGPQPREARDPNAPTYRTPGGPTANATTPGGVERKRPGPGTGPTGKSPDGTDMFQPMTSYVAKEEEAKAKRGNATRGPTPEEIRIADFRKRELVFQPKRKKLPPGKMVKRTEITEMAAHKKKIKIDSKIVVSEFAQRMGEKANSIVKKLMDLGTMATINQTIDFDIAALIANEFGWEVENVAFNEAAALKSEAESSGDVGTELRPPVITVMGHVDHGKTSLLDAIRNATVASGEAGGITQHIGAYSVEVNGKPITFLDTPGHEAFANMRSRGANLTDIVVLVVAADDSIMPQTKEAIAHAQGAGVPIIVAANKIDKPNANIEKVKKDLSIHNILVEEWGGEVPIVGVSALKKTGLTELLETIQLQAEVLDLKANPNRPAEGVVLESRMEKGRGIVTDLLVNEGTLKAGDIIVVGTAYGRVRAMTNDKAKSISEVKPGFPAEIVGLNDVPSAGDSFYVVKTEEAAKEIIGNRKSKILEEKAIASAPKAMTLEDLMNKLPVPGLKELNLIVKADVFGSAEAIKESIEKIHSDKVKAKVLQSSVGVITENDVLLAKAAKAQILGFNAKPDSKAREIAKREKVEVKHFSIIYQLLDDVRASMENLLEPLRKETLIGKAEVKQVFTVSKLGTVAGSMVMDGKIVRNAFARVIRGKDTVAEGKVVSLKRFKDDASETIKGQECGIGVEKFDTYLPGDIINVYHVELVKQTL
jgi:translation initiation factor IF-2